MLADGGDALCDLCTLRDQPALFGSVAADATAWRVMTASPNTTCSMPCAALERRRASGCGDSARARRAADHRRRRLHADHRKLRPATQNAYGAGLTHLRRRFGRRRMTDLTPTDVAAYVTAMQAEGFKGWTIKAT